MESSRLHLSHQFVESHGLAHVALDLQLAGHESVHRLQGAFKKLSDLSNCNMKSFDKQLIIFKGHFTRNETDVNATEMR